jgi:hypothetical protein
MQDLSKESDYISGGIHREGKRAQERFGWKVPTRLCSVALA